MCLQADRGRQDESADLAYFWSPLLLTFPALQLLLTNMAYPGDGYHMSNYGVKTFTAEEDKEQWREHVEREARATRGRRTRGPGGSPPVEEGTQRYKLMSYFGNGKEHQKATTYDKLAVLMYKVCLVICLCSYPRGCCYHKREHTPIHSTETTA